MKALRTDTRGIVFIEFLIAFMPFFLLFLGGVQLAFLAQAHAVVRHAALRAARTAVITIDDDPYFYDDEPRKKLLKGAKKAKKTAAETAVEGLAEQAAPHVAGAEESAGNRLKRIRNAAYVPLSAIGPTRQQVARWIPFSTYINPDLKKRSLYDATGDEPKWRVITGFGVYARLAAAITFPRAPGESELLKLDSHQFGDSDNVTVRVTYLYACQVPIVRSLICRSTLDMTGIPEAVRKTIDAAKNPSFASVSGAVNHWKNDFPKQWNQFKAQSKELMEAEWWPLQLLVRAHLDERFSIITHEATLPNHGAAYEYYTEKQKSKKP